MTENATRTLFLTAAIFNWAAGLALVFNAPLLFSLFSISPAPAEPLFLQLFSWLVIVFGVGYYWVSRDPAANVPIIKLGILGKASVVLVSLACVLTSVVSWQIMLLTSVDLLYAILFWRALKTARPVGAGLAGDLFN
jgi:apolipoprotein N-acyltransferase